MLTDEEIRRLSFADLQRINSVWQENNLPQGVKPDYTGQRDPEASAWHRILGYDAPAVDLDDVLVEYDGQKPIAIIEYKTYMPDMSSANIQTIKALCEAADLPFYVAVHNKSCTKWKVIQGNRSASCKMPNEWRTDTNDLPEISGLEFAAWRYWIAGRKLPKGIAEKIKENDNDAIDYKKERRSHMLIPKNYNNVTNPEQNDKKFDPLSPGGHHMIIKSAEESKTRNGQIMIVIDLDTDADDSQPGWMAAAYEADTRESKKWPFSGRKYLTVETASGDCNWYFKQFLKSVEASNEGWHPEWNDNFCGHLTGCKVGAVYGYVLDWWTAEERTTRNMEIRSFCGTSTIDEEDDPGVYETPRYKAALNDGLVSKYERKRKEAEAAALKEKQERENNNPASDEEYEVRNGCTYGPLADDAEDDAYDDNLNNGAGGGLFTPIDDPDEDIELPF